MDSTEWADYAVQWVEAFPNCTARWVEETSEEVWEAWELEALIRRRRDREALARRRFYNAWQQETLYGIPIPREIEDAIMEPSVWVKE